MAYSMACNSSSSFSSWRRRMASKIRMPSPNSDLTESSLNEFNRRNEAKISPSPYYKGLTDSSLSINRLKNAKRSPGRESYITTATNSSLSTFLIKARKLGSSCFSGRVKSDSKANVSAFEQRIPPPSPPAVTHPARPSLHHPSVSPSFLRSEMEVRMDLGDSEASKEIGEKNGGERRSFDDRKSMGERIALVSKISVVEEIERKESEELMVKEEENEKKFVWADKYRPNGLKDFICNRGKAQLLQDMIAQGECTHFIFEGPPGVGKRTMIMAFLREAFGTENLETRDEMKEFELKGEAVARIEVKVKSSPQHIELNLPDLCGYEKHVLMELLCDNSNCLAIVLHKADKLSADAQHYIRWVVERYKSCSKLLFCCSDVSKLQPIKSICTLIELLPPSNLEIIEVMKYIAEQEGIELAHSLAEKITNNSTQNLRQAIRSFEATWKLSHSFEEDQVVLTGWEDDIANIAKSIIREQSPKQLYIIRGKLQNLIGHNVSPEFIFSVLNEELKKHLDGHFEPELKKHLDEHFIPKIDALYLEYNDSRFPLEDDKSPSLQRRELPGKRHNDPVRNNVHHFMRIEEFIAKCMSLYKTYVKNFEGPNSPEN